MELLFINWPELATLLGIVVSVIVIGGSFMSRFLEDKKDKVTYRLEIEQLKIDLKKIEEKFKEYNALINTFKEEFHTIDRRIYKLEK